MRREWKKSGKKCEKCLIIVRDAVEEDLLACSLLLLRFTRFDMCALHTHTNISEYGESLSLTKAGAEIDFAM